ncbi:LysR family transcriptional regulator [Paraburkholderia oxyphila]|uniref:LysR family transcriptional regulator n=1 Tax=Paraburkholderia oxyphila TaxID=614212 RepID=UPI0004846A04|nr:LysR family transcriptional regulator [Paraburkholderia oxyphila]
MKYELTDLRLFFAITETQSLAAGAAKMHLSPPSASYRLKNLEQAVGATLFVRGPKGMDLTPAGQVLLDYVRNVLASLERMHGEVARFTNGVKGHIRLVCNSSCLVGLTTPLSRFLAVHPGINVDLEERPSEDISRAVAEGAADIGLLAGDVDVHPLAAIEYAVDELILVAAMQHPLATRPQIRFADALDCDFVAMGRRSSNYHFLLQIAGKLGRRLNVRVNVESFPAVLQFVEQNVGVAIVPRSVAAPMIASGQIAGIALDEPWAYRNQRVVAVDFERLPSFVRQFVDSLVASHPEHGDLPGS